jgi:4-diphosphocytidyl-2-C-methyl-D-erythritol kinase
MVAFPNCKINIGLNILSKRPDGYHDLETIFYPIPLLDAVEVIEDNSLTETVLTQSGNPVPGDPSQNLCLIAYNLLKKDFAFLPFVRMHLHKQIPDRAGLGGGSSDASATLILLNNKFELGLDELQLRQYSEQLGSDCPFFIFNKPCLASGRG